MSSETRLPEGQNWIASTGLSRRSALVATAFAAGFASACQPVASSTVQTAGDGLDEVMLGFPASGGYTMAAFRARPAGVTNAPVIIVVNEIFGVHEWIKDICRRLARAGYYAIAPDYFGRVGDATKEPDFQKLISTIVSKATDAQVLADTDAAVAFAATDGGNIKKLGITGFCWGGRVTWLYAAHNPALDAGVAWYGRLTGEPSDAQPRHAIDVAGALHAPVLGQYGGKDRGIPVADVDAMNAKLKALNSPSSITLYPDADHGFLADYRPSYNEAAAKAGWDASLTWFAKYLK